MAWSTQNAPGASAVILNKYKIHQYTIQQTNLRPNINVFQNYFTIFHDI